MRVAFITREPLIHQFGGSTTAALNLLQVLVANGCDVRMLISSSSSRSPRLFWRQRVLLPSGVTLTQPGFLTLGDANAIGTLRLNLFSPRAWGRFLARLAIRFPSARWLGSIVRSVFGNSIVDDAWDLTPPQPSEIAAAERFIAAQSADIVIVNYAFWAPLLSSPQAAKRRRVILMHDLVSRRVERFQQSGIPLDCCFISPATEIAWLNQADIVLAIQAVEAEEIRSLVTSEVLVQPIVLEPAPTTATQANPNRCLFIGTRILPNQTGIQWFLDHVWPLVLAADQQATLAVAGSVCEVLAAGHPRVQLLGTVPSLDAEFDRAGLCIVPLLVGSGLKIKLLEALAHGKACVSTPIGVQGLEDDAPGTIDVASEPEAFAAAVLSLMSNDALRHQREQASLALVRKRFGPASEAATSFAKRLVNHPPDDA